MDGRGSGARCLHSDPGPTLTRWTRTWYLISLTPLRKMRVISIYLLRWLWRLMWIKISAWNSVNIYEHLNHSLKEPSKANRARINISWRQHEGAHQEMCSWFWKLSQLKPQVSKSYGLGFFSSLFSFFPLLDVSEKKYLIHVYSSFL